MKLKSNICILGLTLIKILRIHVKMLPSGHSLFQAELQTFIYALFNFLVILLYSILNFKEQIYLEYAGATDVNMSTRRDQCILRFYARMVV